jgi:hypothetical protein
VQVLHSDFEWGGRTDWDRGFRAGKYFIGIHARKPTIYRLSISLSFTWTILFNEVYRANVSSWRYFRIIAPENIARPAVFVRQLRPNTKGAFDGLEVWACEGARPDPAKNASVFPQSAWFTDSNLFVDVPDQAGVYELQVRRMRASLMYYVGVRLKYGVHAENGTVPFDIQVLDGRSNSQFLIFPDTQSPLSKARGESETPFQRTWRAQRTEARGPLLDTLTEPTGTFLGAPRGSCEDLGTCDVAVHDAVENQT